MLANGSAQHYGYAYCRNFGTRYFWLAAVVVVVGKGVEKEFTLLLVVSRKIGERILIGDKIAVTVVKVGGGGVRIGIEAPTEMAIIREELAEQLRQAERDTLDNAQGSSPQPDPAGA